MPTPMPMRTFLLELSPEGAVWFIGDMATELEGCAVVFVGDTIIVDKRFDEVLVIVPI